MSRQPVSRGILHSGSAGSGDPGVWVAGWLNGLPRPPKSFENASGRPQDYLKIDIFEVFVRKTRKCVWSYYSNVFLICLG